MTKGSLINLNRVLQRMAGDIKAVTRETPSEISTLR